MAQRAIIGAGRLEHDQDGAVAPSFHKGRNGRGLVGNASMLLGLIVEQVEVVLGGVDSDARRV